MWHTYSLLSGVTVLFIPLWSQRTRVSKINVNLDVKSATVVSARVESLTDVATVTKTGDGA